MHIMTQSPRRGKCKSQRHLTHPEFLLFIRKFQDLTNQYHETSLQWWNYVCKERTKSTHPPPPN